MTHHQTRAIIVFIALGSLLVGMQACAGSTPDPVKPVTCPPPLLVAAPVATEAPTSDKKTGRNNGTACKADSECQSNLCDRGACTDSGGNRNWGHGNVCKANVPHERPYAIELEERNRRYLLAKCYCAPNDSLCMRAYTGGSSACGGYICIDDRCRSCVSDAECVYWKGRGTCRNVPGIVGKSCDDSPFPTPDPPDNTPTLPPGYDPDAGFDAGEDVFTIPANPIPPGMVCPGPSIVRERVGVTIDNGPWKKLPPGPSALPPKPLPSPSP